MCRLRQFPVKLSGWQHRGGPALWTMWITPIVSNIARNRFRIGAFVSRRTDVGASHRYPPQGARGSAHKLPDRDWSSRGTSGGWCKAAYCSAWTLDRTKSPPRHNTIQGSSICAPPRGGFGSWSRHTAVTLRRSITSGVTLRVDTIERRAAVRDAIGGPVARPSTGSSAIKIAAAASEAPAAWHRQPCTEQEGSGRRCPAA